MKYLVTGGAGFIGSHITKALVKRGDSVIVLDNLITGKEDNLELVKEKIKFVRNDILNFELLDELTRSVDGVFHQAALASVQDSYNKPEKYQKKIILKLFMQVPPAYMEIQKKFQ